MIVTDCEAGCHGSTQGSIIFIKLIGAVVLISDDG